MSKHPNKSSAESAPKGGSASKFLERRNKERAEADALAEKSGKVGSATAHLKRKTEAKAPDDSVENVVTKTKLTALECVKICMEKKRKFVSKDELPLLPVQVEHDAICRRVIEECARHFGARYQKQFPNPEAAAHSILRSKREALRGVGGTLVHLVYRRHISELELKMGGASAAQVEKTKKEFRTRLTHEDGERISRVSHSVGDMKKIREKAAGFTFITEDVRAFEQMVWEHQKNFRKALSIARTARETDELLKKLHVDLLVCFEMTRESVLERAIGYGIQPAQEFTSDQKYPDERLRSIMSDLHARLNGATGAADAAWKRLASAGAPGDVQDAVESYASLVAWHISRSQNCHPREVTPMHGPTGNIWVIRARDEFDRATVRYVDARVPEKVVSGPIVLRGEPAARKKPASLKKAV